MDQSNVLYVEGSNDMHIISALLRNHGFADSRRTGGERDGSHYFVFSRGNAAVPLRIVPNDTVSTLSRVLRVQARLPSISRVAVVADSDREPDQRWRSFFEELLHLDYNDPPERIPNSGYISASPALPKIGIWLMPDNLSQGYIESFLCRLIVSSDSLWPRAKSAVSQIPDVDRRFLPMHQEKAELFTWLAWQQDPGKRMAEALKAGYLDPHCESALAFLDWLNRWLFS